LGFTILLERLWEWETLMPKVTPLLQISHFAICCTSLPEKSPTLKNRGTNNNSRLVCEMQAKFSFL
jgi:hypothetical protein